jgi:hypothetical protein
MYESVTSFYVLKAHSQETTGMVVTTLMVVALRCGRKRETTLSCQVSAALTKEWRAASDRSTDWKR